MKLIGIDLDGTLLNSDQSISQKNARTMQEQCNIYLKTVFHSFVLEEK